MNLKEKFKKAKGITLIALVVTIIVLLMLAGISIQMLTGNNGILTKTSDAKTATDIADIKEQIQIDIIGKQAKNQGDISDSELKEILEKYGTINYEEDETTIKSITTTKGNYEIAISDIWSRTTSGVSVGDIFDSTGEEDGKLHIGDFINYTARTWNETDMTTIAKTGVTPNNSTSLPSSSYQFGGFVVGGSRDGNATSYSTSYAYVQDKATGSAVTGWRLFDVSDDGVITLISAGCPEDYYHPSGTNCAYISEYILTGNTNSNAENLGLGSTYKSRDWSMYVNEKYKGTTASATALTKSKLDTWYSKYITKSDGANTWTAPTFKLIYGTRYESLIDNYSYYWLSSASNRISVYSVNPNFKCVYNGNDINAIGVRVLVSLTSDVKLSDKATGTKTIVSRNKEYIYNVWNLK